jgi:hypothetical protein
MNPSASIEVQGSNVTVNWQVIVTRSTEGLIDYTVDVTTIRLSGEDGAINQLPTLMIFDAVGKTTVAQGVAKGYTPCPVSCDLPSTARVKEQGCVTRNGQGAATQFLPCADSGCCTRTYTVCCPDGATMPVITLVRSEGAACTGLGGCQSTCP